MIAKQEWNGNTCQGCANNSTGRIDSIDKRAFGAYFMLLPDQKLADGWKSAAHQKCRREKQNCGKKKLDACADEEIIAGKSKNSGIDKHIDF